MATAPATADTEVRAAFRALLTAERAGYKLATALVSTLVTYLVGSVELSDVSELDLSDLLTTAEEAWAATHDGEELPNVHRQRLMRWVANVPASISVQGDTTVALSSSTGSKAEDMSKPFGADQQAHAAPPLTSSAEARFPGCEPSTNAFGLALSVSVSPKLSSQILGREHSLGIPTAATRVVLPKWSALIRKA